MTMPNGNKADEIHQLEGRLLRWVGEPENQPDAQIHLYCLLSPFMTTKLDVFLRSLIGRIFMAPEFSDVAPLD